MNQAIAPTRSRIGRRAFLGQSVAILAGLLMAGSIPNRALAEGSPASQPARLSLEGRILWGERQPVVAESQAVQLKVIQFEVDDGLRGDVRYVFRDDRHDGGVIFRMTLLSEAGEKLAEQSVIEGRIRPTPQDRFGKYAPAPDQPNRFGKAKFRFAELPAAKAEKFRLEVEEDVAKK